MDRRGGFFQIQMKLTILILVMNFACSNAKVPSLSEDGTTKPDTETDPSAPTAPVVTSPASPYFSKSTSVVVSGSCMNNTTVTITGANSRTTTCFNSSFSLPVSVSEDGNYDLKVTQSKLGHTSPAANLSWTVDNLAPSSLSILIPASSPHNANGDSITLSGACETGATVQISGASTSSMTCTNSAYFFSVSQNTDGNHSYSVSQTDPAGNASTASSFTWARDTAAPSAPVLSAPTNPLISNQTNINLTGTCESGSIVNLTGDSTATANCTSGAYSFLVTKSIDGVYSWALTQTDPSSNVSAPTHFQWTRDTIKPAAPIVKTPVINPFSSGDNALMITVNCENGASVNLSGAGSDGGVCTDAVIRFTLNQASNGNYDYNLTQTDLAGNISNPSTFRWTVDDTKPATPTITVPAGDPFYSNLNTVTVSGACITGHTVSLEGSVVFSDVTSPAGVLTQACAGSAYSFTLQKTTDSGYLLLVNQENTSTSVVSADASVEWIRDTVNPAVPVITNPASSPYIAKGNLTVSGTCEAGATVQVTGALTQTAPCPDGTFTATLVKSVDATYNFNFSQMDRAGNTSSNVPLQWVRDSSILASPVITVPAVTDYSSNSTGLTISGTCISGNTITLAGEVVADDVTSPAASLTQTCTNSSFTYTLGKTTDGTYEFTVKQTSTGQGDSALVPLNWTRDTTPPETTLTLKPSDPSLKWNADFTFSSSDASATFECQLESAGYSSCASPLVYSNVTSGTRTFSVRAKDTVGNLDPTPVSYTWEQMSFKTIALYHFNAGSSLVDSSLFPGSLSNPLTDMNSSTPVSAYFGDGRRLTAASSEYLSKSDSASLQALNETMTFETRVRFATLPASGYYVLASKNGISGDMGWEVRLRKTTAGYFITFHGSTDGTTLTRITSLEIFPNTMDYHHIAVTWDKGSIKFYFDGLASGSGTLGTVGNSVLFPSTADLRIGRTEAMSGTVKYLDGVVDEMRLSRVLRWTTDFTVPASEYPAVD